MRRRGAPFEDGALFFCFLRLCSVVYKKPVLSYYDVADSPHYMDGDGSYQGLSDIDGFGDCMSGFRISWTGMNGR